jgi:hypothetical protein
MDEHDPERLPLEQRQDDLLLVHGDAWRAALPAWAKACPHAFRRGLVGHASVTATDLLKRGAALFDAAPVSDLQIRNLAGRMPQVAACPLLARLTALDFHTNHLTPDDLRALAASPHLGALRELTLYATVLHDKHAEVLAGWQGLPRLRRLAVATADGALGAVAGAAEGRLASLRRLTLWGWSAPAELAALCDAAPALARLDVPSTVATPPALQALAGLPSLTGLRLLGEESASASALAGAELTGRLTSLELAAAALSPRALASLAAGGGLARLRRLSLNAASRPASLGAEAARLLAAALPGSLVRLDLERGAGLDAAAARLLAGSERLAGLRWLNLHDNPPIGDGGAEALAASPHLTGLLYLDLSNCGIGPAGAAAQAASPNLARLRHLRLNYNPVGDEGARALAGSPHLDELHTLDLMRTDVGEEGARALARSRGLGGLRRLDVRLNHQAAGAVGDFADPSRLPRLLALEITGQRHGGALVALGRPLVL